MAYQTPYNDDPTTHRHDSRSAANGAPPHPAPAPRPPRRRARIPALALGAYGAGLLGVVLAAVSLALFLTYRGQAQAQLRQVRQALATTQANLAKAQSDNASKYTRLVGTVSSIANTLAPYTSICSTDLQGQNGPAQYWFTCSAAKP